MSDEKKQESAEASGYVYGDTKILVMKCAEGFLAFSVLLTGVLCFAFDVPGKAIVQIMLMFTAICILYIIMDLEWRTKYRICDEGIFLNCRLRPIKKHFKWEEVAFWKEEMLLVHFWDRGQFMEMDFYIFSTDSHCSEHIYDKKVEAIQKNRKRRVICIPKNEETIRC